MKNKQSCVEWLRGAFYDYAESTIAIDCDKWVIEEEALEKLFEQVRAMHKEEIINVYKDILWYQGNVVETESEEYYNETFGNGKETK